jgi:hypothetical protein
MEFSEFANSDSIVALFRALQRTSSGTAEVVEDDDGIALFFF